MTGHERVLTLLDGQPSRKSATDYRVMVNGQWGGAEQFAFDDVSGSSDPAREAADFGTPETITSAIGECHRPAGPRYIVGAGGKVPPRDTPLANRRALVGYAQEHRP